jgi:hypothetical protein
MNEKQSEALRLADALMEDNKTSDCVKSAVELRRLHQVNAELVEALHEVVEAFEIAHEGGGINFYQYALDFRAIIAKAEGRS